ncbi:cytochrome P450, partial [Punctularia strigosozonata HHB-11173 SS5]|uniref:cytochrome P450 n=1 Tax=Punctularia strigosozonata (strain HHB-11173) TaxID=741275 RepID=UPI0004417E23
GSDNTSTGTALVLYFLLADPRYYKMAQAEVDRTFPDRNGTLSHTVLAELPFLNAVLSESLRLGTPFFLPRVVPPEGRMIDGRFVPGGTIVAIAAYSQQVSPDNFYPDPMDFRPERWLDGGLGPGSITNKTALHSFSTGPYVCLGKPLAWIELRHLLARILLTYDMELPADFDIAGYRNGILNMRTTCMETPLTVHAKRRPGVDIDLHL